MISLSKALFYIYDYYYDASNLRLWFVHKHILWNATFKKTGEELNLEMQCIRAYDV